MSRTWQVVGFVLGVLAFGIAVFQFTVSDPVSGPWIREQAVPWVSALPAVLRDYYLGLLDGSIYVWWANPLAGLLLAALLYRLGLVMVKAYKDVKFGRERDHPFFGWSRVGWYAFVFLLAAAFFFYACRNAEWYYNVGMLCAAAAGVGHGVFFSKVWRSGWGGRVYR
ncbi:hypothetical protein [Nonomuraea sp. CA-141351]|uniref:hypothetical protein n=1 Tax=Nonomuraea sp. CA-141351 TaxID=3239996 RepID=UPI003D8BA5E1